MVNERSEPGLSLEGRAAHRQKESNKLQAKREAELKLATVEAKEFVDVLEETQEERLHGQSKGKAVGGLVTSLALIFKSVSPPIVLH